MNKLTTKGTFCAIFGALMVIIASTQNAAAGRRAFYLEDQYWNPDAALQTRCKNSNYNTLFLFTMQIDADGALRYNDHKLVDTNGTWVGGSWNSKIAGCRGGAVASIEVCIGNWGTQSFNHVRDLVAAGSPKLRKNFTVLKQNMPTLDAIQMDDETTYDRHSMVALCSMITDVGFAKVTLCPYTNSGFWAGVKSDLGSRVGAVWLQCYDGGASNVPLNWKSALGNTSVLYPGLWYFDGKTAVKSKMTTWHNQGFNGGFLLGGGSVPGGLPDSTWCQQLIDAGF